MTQPPLTPELRFASLAESGANVFLTGRAGTGKSYNIDQFTEAHPDTEVTASTGIAALNVGGMTIHRWSGIMIGPKPGEDFEGFFDFLARDKRRGIRAAFNRVRGARRLVIDEISMLPGRLLDYLDFHCRQIRGVDLPFGGIQVISTGDFCQLPPVRTRPYLPYDWAFESDAWSSASFQTVELTHIHRQQDPAFASALSSFRLGQIPPEVADLLKPRVAVFPDRNLTRLLTHNNAVTKWNDYCLNELPGNEWVREAETFGPDHQLAFLEKNLLTPRTLRLKVGAKVMFTVNRPNDGFVNGQTGTVVKLGRHSVEVANGQQVVTVEPYTWFYDPHDQAGATFTQFPLRLAYAVTIHKSQGLSLDSAFVDIRAAREPGQGYVALSRVRTLEGLHLKDWPRGVYVSQRAIDFHSTATK